MFNLKEEIGKLHHELIALRRDFHGHPELGLHEVRTSGIIEEYLKALGLEVRRCYNTGVIGVLRSGKPGKTLMLRSDMDALPVTEENDLPFSSAEPGVMHACGHDGHMSMLLVAAKILAAHKDEFSGDIVFLFQPNEEDAGAEAMIRDGALDDPKPDAVCGLHIWSPIKTGKIGIVTGPIMASSYYFKVTIHGKGGHGGAPHTAINPIDGAAHVLEAIKTLHTLEFDSLKPTVISVCKIHGGAKQIIVPESCELEGSIRCLHEDDQKVRARFKETVEQVCAAYGMKAEIEMECGNTLLSNDKEMAELVRRAAKETVGEKNIQSENVATMLGDDFAEFTRRIPGAYYFLGTGNAAKGTDFEHHNSRFNIDECSLPIGVEMHVRCALGYLSR